MREKTCNTVGERIRYLRESAEMTRSLLAKKLYVNRRTVSRWEDNEISPRIRDIEALSKIFDVSCDYLILGESRK
jgi:transcriptional regulator with XRE-family HTH domain